MSVEFTFTLELYALITYNDVTVNSSCIQIGIHKRVAALWPRLLHDKSRPPWITFDAEHSTLDSSDDESDSDIEEPLKLVTRMYLNVDNTALSYGRPM